jgi:hypothetical protein
MTGVGDPPPVLFEETLIELLPENELVVPTDPDVKAMPVTLLASTVDPAHPLVLVATCPAPPAGVTAPSTVAAVPK